MRKYPKAPNTWFNKSSIISFFFAWNAFGIMLYRYFNNNEKRDKEMERLTFKQKYLQIISNNDNETKFRQVKMKGFTVEEKTDLTLGELLKQEGVVEKKVNDADKTEIPDIAAPLPQSS